MDIGLYLRSLWSNWWALMSCAVFTLLGALVLYLRKSETWALWATFVTAIVLLFVASFLAWRDEHAKVISQLGVAIKLQRQLENLKKSNISGRIDWAVLGSQTEGSHIGVIASLINSGASSAVDPSTWVVSVNVGDGRIVDGYANTLLDKNLDFCFNGTHVMRFVRNDALDRKCSFPIPVNGTTQGFLWFAFPSIKKTDIEKDTTTIKLRATSVSGQSFQISVTVAELKAKANRTTYFPGIENPRMIQMRCSDNRPY